MSLDTLSGIATHISESFDNLPNGISGNLIEIVDMARQHVANYTGQEIGSNSISVKFQPAILDFAKADTIDMATGEGANDNIKLSELIIDGQSSMASSSFRKMGEFKLRMLGRKAIFSRSLS